MAENISSRVLFHITSSGDNIVNILRNGFFPHFCPEYSFGPLHEKAARNNLPPAHAAPIVCFCDLPLSLIRKHLGVYGQFGIGLNKAWGIKNGVAPVFYTHEDAQTFKPLSALNWAARAANDPVAIHDLRLLTAYMKPVRGNAWIRKDGKGKVVPDVHFYDEREWRYVPQLPVGESLFLSRRELKNKSKVEARHAEFQKKYNLPVSPDDIQYLIVPTDREVIKLAKHVRQLYSEDDATLVTTAIMTVDCITDDL